MEALRTMILEGGRVRRDGPVLRPCMLWIAALLLLAVTGCCSGQQNGLHPHQHTLHQPTVLERAEQAADQGGAALDNLDERLENRVW